MIPLAAIWLTSRSIGLAHVWTHITTVAIPGSLYSGVVLYDQAAGHGEIHRCNGSGELELIMQSDGWRTSWTHVVGDAVAGGGLLFYEGSTGYGGGCILLPGMTLVDSASRQRSDGWLAARYRHNPRKLWMV